MMTTEVILKFFYAEIMWAMLCPVETSKSMLGNPEL